MLFVVCRSLLVGCFVLSGAWRLQCGVRCSVLVVCCSLCVVCCASCVVPCSSLLSVVCRLLLVYVFCVVLVSVVSFG